MNSIYKGINILFFTLIGALLLYSCKVAGELSSNKDTTNKGEEGGGTARIIFLNYEITKSAAGNQEIRLLNKIIASGELKKNSQPNNLPRSGDLMGLQLDANDQVIEVISIPNPLVRTVEYLDESGQLTKKQLELDSTQFSIRMQLDARAESIEIAQIKSPEGDNTSLLVTKIK